MNRLRRAVGEELVAAYKDVEMPPKLVENEARSMLQQAVEQARRQGQKAEAPENGHEGFMDAARKRVLVGLVVGEVARRNELRLDPKRLNRSEEHTSELQSLMRISYAVFCLKKKKRNTYHTHNN